MSICSFKYIENRTYFSIVNLIQKIAFAVGPIAWLLMMVFGNNSSNPELYKMLGIAFWMMLWWITEVVPIYVTALLPMVLFPSLGLFSTKKLLHHTPIQLSSCLWAASLSHWPWKSENCISELHSTLLK